jgi:hypothetical protein
MEKKLAKKLEADENDSFTLPRTIFNESKTKESIAVFCIALTLFYLQRISLEIYKNKEHTFITMLAIISLPVVQMGFTITTTDAPLMLFWTMSTYYGYMAIFKDKIR